MYQRRLWLCSLVILLFPTYSQGGYNKTKWGMTVSEVSKSGDNISQFPPVEDEAFSGQEYGKARLRVKDYIFGKKFIGHYLFQGDALSAVEFIIETKSDADFMEKKLNSLMSDSHGGPFWSHIENHGECQRKESLWPDILNGNSVFLRATDCGKKFVALLIYRDLSPSH